MLTPAAHGEVVLEEATEVDPDSVPAPVDSEAQAMDPVAQDLDLEGESALVDSEDRLDMVPVVKEALAPAVKVATEEVRVDLALAVVAHLDMAPVVKEDSAPVVKEDSVLAVKVATEEVRVDLALAVDSAPVVKEDSVPAVKVATEEVRVDSAPVVREVTVRVDSPETKEVSALVVPATAPEAKEEVSALAVASAQADREDSAPVVKVLEDTLAVLPATVAKQYN